MTTLTVSLPEADKAFAEERAIAEGYSSVDEYVQTLLQQARVNAAKRKLEETLLRAMQEPATEITREDWDGLRRQILDRSPELRNGE